MPCAPRAFRTPTSASSADRLIAWFLVTATATTFWPARLPIGCASGAFQLELNVVVAQAARLAATRTTTSPCTVFRID